MPQILSLLKYSFLNRRSTALVAYSMLAAIWVSIWLLIWAVGFILAEPDSDGGQAGFLAGMCVWFIVVAAFCVLPVVIQLAWARKVQEEEAAAMPGPWLYGPAPVYQAPPVPLAYQPTYPASGDPETGRLLEAEKQRTRDLEYENILLKQKVRDQESARRSMTTVEKLVEAQGLEHERRYDEAGQVYEEMGRWEDASRVRMLQIKGGNL